MTDFQLRFSWSECGFSPARPAARPPASSARSGPAGRRVFRKIRLNAARGADDANRRVWTLTQKAEPGASRVLALPLALTLALRGRAGLSAYLFLAVWLAAMAGVLAVMFGVGSLVTTANVGLWRRAPALL